MKKYDFLDNLNNEDLKGVLIFISKYKKNPGKWLKSQVKKYLDSDEGVCSSYLAKVERKPLYDQFTGYLKGFYLEQGGICLGTKDCDTCKCKGNRNNCDFY